MSKRLHVRRISINKDGYDSNGRYWGIGERLYWCSDIADMSIAWQSRSYIRAKDFSAAHKAFREVMDLIEQREHDKREMDRD